MKNLLIITLVLASYAFTSCTKTDLLDKVEVATDEISVALTVDMIAHRGVYVNNFKDDIMGISSEEDYLLDWCVANNFNEITLYNIGTILNTAVDTALLADFVDRAKNDYELKVGFVAASKTTINEINTYNATHPLGEAPSAIATEYEFWNPGYNFKYYKTKMLKTLAQIDTYFDPNWEQQLYVGRFEDEAEAFSDEHVLRRTIRHLSEGGGNDELFWVNYRTNAQNFPDSVLAPNSYQRIQDIATESYEQGTVTNVVILFNVRTDSGSPNIYNYFDASGDDNEFYKAFENYKEGFDLSDIEYKDNINLIGYQIYRYSNAKLARPL